MDIQTKKIQFIQEFLSLNNEAIIDKLESILKKERQKEIEKRISIEQYNIELEEANVRIERGEYITHEEIVKESASWLD